MGGIIYWTIRATVIVAWIAFLVALIPSTGFVDYLNQLPDFVVYWLGYFLFVTYHTIVMTGDLARFVIRRFNP
ncbi:hypothetical protein [Sphingomonas sp. DT-204]|uniref:hypothetical protein n=1 Tax=Sphingomonas sp. DT-204 TaxID=3396166 RepID=UPI003F1B9449